MSLALAAPADPEAHPADPARARLERQLAVLDELAETGLKLCRALEQQTLESAGPQGPALSLGDAALAYGRLSRAVRLTLVLQGKVLEERKALDDLAERRRRQQEAEAQARRAQSESRAARREEVEQIAGQVIRAEGLDPSEADRLAADAAERLDRDDIYDALADHPAGEIVARLCRDLGLEPDWSRWAQEAWAQEAGLQALTPEGAEGGPAPPPAPERMTVRWLDLPYDPLEAQAALAAFRGARGASP
jgi:hypothetical protein